MNNGNDTAYTPQGGFKSEPYIDDDENRGPGDSAQSLICQSPADRRPDVFCPFDGFCWIIINLCWKFFLHKSMNIFGHGVCRRWSFGNTNDDRGTTRDLLKL